MDLAFTRQMNEARTTDRLAVELLDHLPGLVACFDRDLCYVYANATYRRWRGLDPADVIGRPCREIVGRHHYPAVAARIARAFEGETVTDEYPLFEDGHERHVQGTYLPRLDADGTIVGVILLATPVSSRPDLQARIVESEMMFEDVFANAPIGMTVAMASGRLVRVNQVFAAMLGYEVEQMVRCDFRAITHPDDLERDEAFFQQVLSGASDGYRMEKRYVHRDGSIVHAMLAVSAVRGEGGRLLHVVAQIEDITERRLAETRLLEANMRLQLAMDAVIGGFWHIDIAGDRFHASEALARYVTGAPTITAEAYADRIVPEDHAGVREGTRRVASGEIERRSMEYRINTVQGLRWVRCDARLVRDADGRPEQVVGVVIDISDQRERQNRAEREADTDALTGLLNRRGLVRRLEAIDPDRPIGVIAIDLDRFKQINDRFGHDAGDAVLVATADRLRSAVRATDLAVRFGGDEFGLLLPGIDAHALARVADTLTERLRAPLEYGGAALPVGASIGVAHGIRPAADLLCEADRQLYQSKLASRDHAEDGAHI